MDISPRSRVPAATWREHLTRARRGVLFLLRSVRPRLRAKALLARAHQEAAENLTRSLPAGKAELAARLRAQIIGVAQAR